jgi:hypothetical protein
VRTQAVSQADWPAASIGLTLTRWASGVKSEDSSILWTNNVTLNAVAAAVIALGNSWTAQVSAGFGLWASADIIHLQGPQNALGIPGNLNIHTTDLNDFDLIQETGEFRFSSSLTNIFGSGWAP